MRKKLILVVILLLWGITLPTETSGQIQPRKGSSTSVKIENQSSTSIKKETRGTTSTNQNENAKPLQEKIAKNDSTIQAYVISFESIDKIYTDALPNATTGDCIEILAESEPFIHPVTGEKILREENTLGILMVDEIYSSYMKCHASGNEPIDSSVVGLKIRKSRKSQNSYNADDHTNRTTTNAPLQQDNRVNKLFHEYLAIEQANLPLKIKKFRIEPYVIEGNILYKNIVFLNKKHFNKDKKDKEKLTFEIAEIASKDLFFKLAKEAGYKSVLRYFSPDKTQSFEIEIP